MPQYSWKCDAGHITEVVRSISEHDIPPEKCEGSVADEKSGAQPCPSTKFEKYLTGGRFMLLGSSWSRDGYR